MKRRDFLKLAVAAPLVVPVIPKCTAKELQRVSFGFQFETSVDFLCEHFPESEMRGWYALDIWNIEQILQKQDYLLKTFELPIKLVIRCFDIEKCTYMRPVDPFGAVFEPRIKFKFKIVGDIETDDPNKTRSKIFDYVRFFSLPELIEFANIDDTGKWNVVFGRF